LTDDTPFEVWQGIYSSFAEAPVAGPGFSGTEWIERTASNMRRLTSSAANGQTDFSLLQRNSVLTVLAASLLSDRPRIRILDFGGGPGYGYFVLLNAIPDAARRIDYHIVELESICRDAAGAFPSLNAPRFHPTFPEGMTFDIVFTASTLQYIEDWQAICERLADCRSPYLVFGDVFAGRFESWVSLQSYYGSKIAHWFLNEEAFLEVVTRRGYELRLKSDCNVKVLGRDGPLPMDNFPVERRLRNTSHFMFSLPSSTSR
jgi:putative methyltransferase (TIGR04325 family)